MHAQVCHSIGVEIRGQLCELVLPFHHAGPRALTQVIRLSILYRPTFPGPGMGSEAKVLPLVSGWAEVLSLVGIASVCLPVTPH